MSAVGAGAGCQGQLGVEGVGQDVHEDGVVGVRGSRRGCELDGRARLVGEEGIAEYETAGYTRTSTASATSPKRTVPAWLGGVVAGGWRDMGSQWAVKMGKGMRVSDFLVRAWWSAQVE